MAYLACNSRVSCKKGPTRHADAWQIGPVWQDTLELSWGTLLVFSLTKPRVTVSLSIVLQL